MVYIGETKQTIKDRVYQHLQTILKFHKFFNKLDIILIRKIIIIRNILEFLLLKISWMKLFQEDLLNMILLLLQIFVAQQTLIEKYIKQKNFF